MKKPLLLALALLLTGCDLDDFLDFIECNPDTAAYTEVVPGVIGQAGLIISDDGASCAVSSDTTDADVVFDVFLADKTAGLSGGGRLSLSEVSDGDLQEGGFADGVPLDEEIRAVFTIEDGEDPLIDRFGEEIVLTFTAGAEDVQTVTVQGQDDDI